ncbi:MAG: YicC family protein [Gammaproteobacteria bacterium]
MTAFARREQRADWGVLTWELRSLNHRFLEVATRLPDELRGLEAAVRERVAQTLGRGKVECGLRLQRAGGARGGVALNDDLLRRVLELAREVDGMHANPAPLGAMEIMRWPGVVEEVEQDLEPISAAALELLDAALAELVATREREGERLRAIVEQRCAAMAQLAADVRAHLPEIRTQVRTRLEERLAEMQVQAEPGRVEQELVLQLQKLDVDEELDRLQTHLQEVADVLGRDEPVGRRLDFLMQELNREANTLGSKSAVVETTRAAVELKVLIEQMREQVQNIE